MRLKIKRRMKHLKSYYSNIKIKKIFIFVFIIQLFFSCLMIEANANSIKKSNETIELMLSEAKQHAIDTINLDPKKRTIKVKALIQKFVNIDFMARATTGAFWKKATKTQKDEYKVVLLNQIINTIEAHLNTLSTLSHKIVNTELRGKKLVYVRGIIQDPQKTKPSINILWKLAANKKQSFAILDLEIEGVSLVSSHKAETISILRKNKGSFEALLSQLNQIK